jgi:hypothetical protein
LLVELPNRGRHAVLALFVCDERERRATAQQVFPKVAEQLAHEANLHEILLRELFIAEDLYDEFARELREHAGGGWGCSRVQGGGEEADEVCASRGGQLRLGDGQRGYAQRCCTVST